jgi:hypothetical protein
MDIIILDVGQSPDIQQVLKAVNVIAEEGPKPKNTVLGRPVANQLAILQHEAGVALQNMDKMPRCARLTAIS